MVSDSAGCSACAIPMALSSKPFRGNARSEERSRLMTPRATIPGKERLRKHKAHKSRTTLRALERGQVYGGGGHDLAAPGESIFSFRGRFGDVQMEALT